MNALLYVCVCVLRINVRTPALACYRSIGSGRLRVATAGALHRRGTGALFVRPAGEGVLPAVPSLERGHGHGRLGGRASASRGMILLLLYSSTVISCSSCHVPLCCPPPLESIV